MSLHVQQNQTVQRYTRMLRSAFGGHISDLLADDSVVEVMLNPDGRIWVDRLSSGLADTGERLSAEDGERIIRLIAHHVGSEAHATSPRLSAELPETGERFEGLLPPLVASPSFSIRNGMGSYFFLSRLAKTAAADASEISCSLERPPYSTPTRSRFTVRGHYRLWKHWPRSSP